MKILCFNGSPRTNGSTVTLLKEFEKTAKGKGHSTEIFNVYQHKISGCIHCNQCKETEKTFCSINDDFQAVIRKIQQADCILFASPVYFGQITGHLKCLLDRFFCFAGVNFKLRDLEGKKFASIIVSGAPAHVFKDLHSYLKKWMCDFLKMEYVGSVTAGETCHPGSVVDDIEAMQQARSLADNLKG